MTIRNSALLACVAGVLGNVFPVWNTTRLFVETESRSGILGGWFAPVIILMYLFTAIMPVFYFALYRNEGTLRISDGLRRLCLIAALILGAVMALAVVDWVGSLGPFSAAMKEVAWKTGATSVLSALADPRTIGHVSNLLNVIGEVGVIMLLAAFFRERQETSTANIPISRLLAVMTKAAAITWGLWLAFEVIRLVLTPYSYFQLSTYALQIGRTLPRLGDMMARMTREVLSVACLYVVPFVVYRRQERRRDSEPVPSDSK